jgi:hypothetical protein
MTKRPDRALALAQPVCRLGAARQPEALIEQGFDARRHRGGLAVVMV